jgi:multiple sugar transport system permease protein
VARAHFPGARHKRDHRIMATPERRPSGLGAQTRRVYILCLIPALLVVLLLVVLPLLYQTYLSFRDFSLLRFSNRFIGIANYARLLQDPLLLKALANTILFTVVATAADFVIAMAMALVVYRLSPIPAYILRAVILLPMMLMPVAVAVLWRNVIFNPPYEVFNRVFGLKGSVLASPNTALWGITLTAIWAFYPMVFLLLSAGLDAIPKAPIEASEIDGASFAQVVWHVILPLMRPVIFVTVTMKAIDSFLTFPFAWIMTEGGPGGASHLLSTYIYTRSFANMDYGYGASLAVFMIVCSAALSFGLVAYVWSGRHGETLS